MTKGRKLRLALGAAILAALFAFVLVGHAGAHAPSTAADSPCAMCSSGGEAAARSAPEPPIFHSPRVLASISQVELECVGASRYAPRGPPLAG